MFYNIPPIPGSVFNAVVAHHEPTLTWSLAVCFKLVCTFNMQEKANRCVRHVLQYPAQLSQMMCW